MYPHSNPQLNFITYTQQVDIYGQYVADRVIEYGDITTAYGIDRITGMPVLVFTSDAPLLGEGDALLEHPNLALTLESGTQGGRNFVVQALPMGYSQVKSLRGVALEHFYDGARAALAYLREKGRPHGAVRMNQLWWDGSHLLLAGAGLPWSDAASVEADVGALEGLVAGLAGTDLSVGRPSAPKLGFVPRTQEVQTPSSSIVISSIASPDTATPSTGSAVSSALQSPSPMSIPQQESSPPILHSKFLPPQVAENSTESEPSPESTVDETVPVRPSVTPGSTPVRSSISLPFSRGLRSKLPRASSDELFSSEETVKVQTPEQTLEQTLEQTPTGSTLGRTPPAEISEAQGVMRIGFEADNSWRKVRSVTTPPSSGSRTPFVVIGLGVLAAAALIGAGSYFLLRTPSSSSAPSGNDPRPNSLSSNDTCCVVTFTLERGGKPVTKQARLLVAQSPVGSPLKAGDVLGIIPGPVRLPANPAKYSLLLQLEGFADQTLDLEMPSSQPVVIGLP